MNDPATDLLLWARGIGWVVALSIFLFGMALRLFEIFAMGRQPDLAPPRPAEKQGSAFRTLWGRFTPYPGLYRQSATTYAAGYLFHIGFLVVLLFSEFHLQLIRHLLGFGWPALSGPWIDASSVIAIVALVALLASRLRHPVKRFISKKGDYLVWILTFLPLLTGWLAYHHLLFPYTRMMAWHLLSAELFLAMLPFTRLIHAVTIIAARCYTGGFFGRKGVQA